MKLLRAKIDNFRLLKDVVLEFSSDPEKNLTVIRAANESGKTTILTALQWGLFGETALPEGGSKYRLSPLDSSSGEKTNVTVSVEIDLEVAVRTSTRTYRLIRTVAENVKGGEFSRPSSNLTLFDLTRKGGDPIDNPEAHLSPHLPKDLREVFFTDGDRALSFIEGKSQDQMKRVEGAIKSLLGLRIIEEAIDHTKAVGRSINKKVKDETGNSAELEQQTELIEKLNIEIPKLESDLNEAKENRQNLESLEREADRQLSEALKKGNKEELERQRQEAKKGREREEKNAEQAARDHANLFKSELLAKHLFSQVFAEAKTILDGLHSAGKIPNQTIPVLEDRLKQPNCICGEILDPNTSEGRNRREHILHLIENSRNSDEIQKKVTELYFSSKQLLNPQIERTWEDEYNDVFARRQRANQGMQSFGERESAIEEQIKSLPDVDIQQLRVIRDRYRAQEKEANTHELTITATLENKRSSLRDAQQKQQVLLAQDSRGQMLNAEREVANDLEQVLTNTLEKMKTDELSKVSSKMNELFLEMIGADEKERSIITKAEITPDYKIIVSGQNGYPLDPSQDLNGASRRALTIAFILALTKISEVEAPNVIDTPLGMMSGYVKHSVLNRAAEESSQLIMFLTHDEIKGCEEVIDERAGKIYTITNPAHYPKILKHKPPVDGQRVIICTCNHREKCNICERRESASAKLA